MRRFLLIALILLAPLGASAQDNDIKLSDPRLIDYQVLIDQMTPEQRAELLEQAAKVEAELKEMSPSEIAEIKKDVLEATKEIDFESVDAKSIDTAKPMAAKRAQQLLIEVHNANQAE